MSKMRQSEDSGFMLVREDRENRAVEDWTEDILRHPINVKSRKLDKGRKARKKGSHKCRLRPKSRMSRGSRTQQFKNFNHSVDLSEKYNEKNKENTRGHNDKGKSPERKRTKKQIYAYGKKMFERSKHMSVSKKFARKQYLHEI